MNKVVKAVFLLATIVSFFDLNQMKDFCEAFKNNNYSISYGFRRITEKDRYLLYVFINHTYWRLKYTDGIDSDKELRFYTTPDKSEESNWFGNQYSMALCIVTPPNSKDCTTYLLAKNESFWHFSTLQSNELTLKDPFESIGVSKDVSNRIGFVPTWGEMEKRLVLLFKHKDIKFDVYQMKDNSQDPIAGPPEKDDQKKPIHPPIDPFDFNSKVVAMYGQYSGADYNKHSTWKPDAIEDKGWGHGVIILFEEQRTLKYCYSSTPEMSDWCKNKRQYKVLINCDTDSSNVTVSANTTKRTTSKDYTLEIVLGVIALLIIVVSIIVIVCLICKEGPKKESVFKGLKPATRSPFTDMGDLRQPSDLNSKTSAKSEIFSVKSGVDYSKPIPLKSNSSVAPSSESIVRPTDLNVKPKPK